MPAAVRNGSSGNKTTIWVDVTSDTVCPWCYVGKLNLDEAISATKDKYNVEVRWHPFLLNPKAPMEGHDKLQYYYEKFGETRVRGMIEHMKKIFSERGLDYKIGGKTGNTMDSHRLLELAAQQGLVKQNALVEELFQNYFTQEKYIGDRDILLAAAEKVGISGAREFLDDPNAGRQEVLEGLREYAKGVTGVPFFRIGKETIAGAQPAEAFVKAFQKAC